ncbi:MAG TPA: hypothetical protein PLH39_01660 [Promineifilum sp.]|nr:hypothetical protein [Promineifilum sp.]
MSTHTGTGRRAEAAGSVAAAAVLANCRVALDDAAAAEFSDADLLTFLNEAIREYSQHLPRVAELTLTALAGVRRYALPGDTWAILDVEYPEGTEPAIYLTRRPYKGRAFAAAPDAYDFLPRHDLTNPPALLLSFDPPTGATLRLRATRPHAALASVNDYLTVPDAHHHVLLQYVLFAAARRLQAAEQAAPSAGSLLMAQLAANARRLELAYLNALNRILTQRTGESAVVSWGAAGGGR